MTLRVPGYRDFAFAATALRVPVDDGELLIEPGGGDFRADLDIGPLTVHAGSRDWLAAVHGGHLRVRNDVIDIDAVAIEFADRIDVRRARAAQGDAAERLREDRGDDDALSALRRANLRLAVAARVRPVAGR
ncbi:F0F1 ATP synthase subunit epsilon [Nocardia arizonensis]|uniref:F0F1 ATP synthase subunit epsilon n=1 Tax=Nocardia arizonensis TaxID=1141647 RepID=UPI00138F8023|nr:F0F1 ATP synthase subunit epsilon [Nocardia arizonensis]